MTEDIKSTYFAGFEAKCAELKLDPSSLVKAAVSPAMAARAASGRMAKIMATKDPTMRGALLAKTQDQVGHIKGMFDARRSAPPKPLLLEGGPSAAQDAEFRQGMTGGVTGGMRGAISGWLGRNKNWAVPTATGIGGGMIGGALAGRDQEQFNPEEMYQDMMPSVGYPQGGHTAFMPAFYDAGSYMR